MNVNEEDCPTCNASLSVTDLAGVGADWEHPAPWRRQAGALSAYGLLLLLGALGNLAVMRARTARARSRLDLLIAHLAAADCCVVCLVIPLEIGWKYTNAWLAGNVLCKLLLVVRAFGLYLSSNVLVCISIDRFFAVLYPLRQSVARRRSKKMLVCAWVGALGCSLPQSLVFRVKQHPHIAGFEQCVSFDAFSSVGQEVAYNVFCLCAVYFCPLLIITVCYLCIFVEIHRTSKQLNDKCPHGSYRGGVQLRASGGGMLERARRRTLRMTLTIVAVFALCWLPYAVMAMWYMIDRAGAKRVSPGVQDLLFAMAVSNSCVNPLVYGSYSLTLRRAARAALRRSCCTRNASPDTIGGTKTTSLKHRDLQSGRYRVRFAESCVAVTAKGTVRGTVRAPPARPPPRLLCERRERARVLRYCPAPKHHTNPT